MHSESIQTELLARLAQQYERDPAQFVTLPQYILDSSLAREAVAELRNEGYVEEQVRGIVRLTAHGYMVHQSKTVPTA